MVRIARPVRRTSAEIQATQTVGAVRLGRLIFTNLRRALVYVTAIHVPIAGLALLPILLGAPPLLFPVHVVLLELVIDPVCSLAFEAEPREPDAMSRPPRPRRSLFGLARGFPSWRPCLASSSPVFNRRARPRPRCRLCRSGRRQPRAGRGDRASTGAGLVAPHRCMFWGTCSALAAVLLTALYIPALSGVFQFAAPPPSSCP